MSERQNYQDESGRAVGHGFDDGEAVVLQPAKAEHLVAGREAWHLLKSVKKFLLFMINDSLNHELFV